MSLIRSLPFPPKPDESARGLIVRVAGDNLCTSGDINKWLGLSPMDLPLDADPGEAAIALGMEPATLAAMGFGQDGTEAFLGHVVPTQMVARWYMRVCPACLAEAPYHRRIWDHRQIAVCPNHRLRLLERCPRCVADGQFGPLRWNRTDMLHCACAHDLREQKAEPAQEWRGAGAVYRVCGLTSEGPELPPEFSCLPLQALLDVLIFLGRMQVVVAEGNPDCIAPAEMTTDPRLLEAGARIAFRWPEAFDDLAEQVKQAYPNTSGLSKQYGHLHRFIYKCGDEPYAGLLRDAYASFLQRRDDISEAAWPSFLPKPAAVQATVGLPGARELLGIGFDAFKSLMELPLWTDLVAVMPGKGGPQYRRSDVLALKAKLERIVTPSVLDNRLGVGAGKGGEFCRLGFIPVHHWNRHARNGWKISVDLADADAFFDRIRELASPDMPKSPVSFAAVMKSAFVRRVVSFEDVMRAIVSGQLRGHVMDGSGHGFASLAFDKANVIEVLEELASSSRTGAMLLGEVVRRLRIPAPAVSKLVDVGLLPKPRRFGGYIFAADAVEGFADLYTYDFDVAQRTAVEPSEVRLTLETAGLRPVVMLPMRRGKVAAVYRRTDLESAVG